LLALLASLVEWLAVSSGGNPAKKMFREADKTSILSRYAGIIQSTGFPPARE
jgi:hypothetical protein